MRKGSVTVFLSLVLVLVLSFLFSLLEGARIYCLKIRAETVTEQCMQSLFGNYQEGLWENYHLLFLDGSWQEEEFSMDKLISRAMEEVKENLSYRGEALGEKGWDMTALTFGNMGIEHYRLATDDGGRVFQSQVALQMQLEAAGNALDELLHLKDRGEDVREETEQKEERWNQAWEAIEEAEEIKEEQEAGENGQNGDKAEAGDDGSGTGGNSSDIEAALPEGGDSSEEVLENPMEYVKELKSSAMLGLVVPDPSKISGKAMEGGALLEDRSLNRGNWPDPVKTGLMDRLWLQYYIQNYFSDFVASSAGEEESAKVLDYEIEYLLGGTKDDSQNLEKVIYELLGLREVMNFVTIMQDSGKRSLALTIATAAVGFTGIVPLINAVQIGILLAWAFIESVLDIRTLLEGKKIPFLKRTDQWASDLTDCRKTVESGMEAKEDGEGLTYGQYLQILLFLRSDETINYRCMDLMERNQKLRMDEMVYAVTGSFTYEAKPLFWNFNLLVQKSWDSFTFPVPAAITYGTAS